MVIFEQVEFLSIHHPDAADFLRAEAQLCPMKLGGFEGQLRDALKSYLDGFDPKFLRLIYDGDAWKGGPLTTVMYALARYCLGCRAIQDLWIVAFGRSRLMTQLVRVIDLIPSGYNREYTHYEEEWGEIHSILTMLLPPRGFHDYNSRIAGYTLDKLHSWELLLHGYDREYPSGDVDRELKNAEEISVRWTASRWRSFWAGGDYQRRSDPFFFFYFAENVFSRTEQEIINNNTDNGISFSDSVVSVGDSTASRWLDAALDEDDDLTFENMRDWL